MKNISLTFKSVRFSFAIVWKYTRIVYLYLAFSSVINIVNSFLLILFPKYLLDNLIMGSYYKAVVIVLLFCVLEQFFLFINSWIEKKRTLCSERRKVHLKVMLINKLSELRYEQMEEAKNIERYEFSKKCIEKGDAESFLQCVFSILSSATILGGTLYIMKGLPLYIWTVIIIVVIANAIGQIVRLRHTYHEMDEETSTERELYYFRGRLLNIEYAKEIRAFRLNNFITQKTISVIERFFSLCQKFNRKHNRTLWWVHIVEGLQTLVLYGYNAILFMENTISIGVFTANISALFQFSNSLNSVFSNVINLSEQGVFLRSFQDFLLLKSSNQGYMSLQDNTECEIRFEDVSFKYPGQEKYALEHINVVISSNEKIAIVGSNGAGKSTFIKLLLGMYKPTSGTILVNGVNIEHLLAKEYKQLFSSVLQDYQLYSFRIIDNFLFNENASEVDREKVNACLAQIKLSETISNLPCGIDTYLTQRFDEKGIELSGGEQQKLAIARLLFRNSPVMILDEPTSALSPQSEYEIYNDFAALTQDKTVLYISHRLSCCTLADRVLVFDKAKIVQNGTHYELLNDAGPYADMFKNQASLYGVDC